MRSSPRNLSVSAKTTSWLFTKESRASAARAPSLMLSPVPTLLLETSSLAVALAVALGVAVAEGVVAVAVVAEGVVVVVAVVMAVAVAEAVAGVVSLWTGKGCPGIGIVNTTPRLFTPGEKEDGEEESEREMK